MPRDSIHQMPGERNILHGLIRVRRCDRLAYILGITVPTVYLHSGNLRRKNGANTMLEVISTAYRAYLKFASLGGVAGLNICSRRDR
jgi:DNA-binding CsgD family transcriptional regulator